MKRTPIRKVRIKPRPGRLKGSDLGDLRIQCLERDGNRCMVCQNWVSDALPDWHDRKAHMAHIKAKRIGLDTIDNVRTLCGFCHRIEHAYGPSGVKPCKAKESVYATPDCEEPWSANDD